MSQVVISNKGMFNETDIHALDIIDEIATRENMQIVIGGVKLGCIEGETYTNKEIS